MFDVVIIGAGVIGCSIARELARYQLDIGVIEKNDDVASGSSKANSGIIHAGEDPIPGTMKAKMNIRGNEMFDQLQKELDFPFKRTGSMVLCFDESELPKLEELRQRGIANGVPDTMYRVDRKEALILEPNLSDKVVAALVLPTGGIVCPYEFTIALAENAHENGVTFLFDTECIAMNKNEEKFIITTNKGSIEAKLVINAAGVYADDINHYISEIKYNIIARKGEYILLDKSAGALVSRTLFQLPTKMGKGILVTPTVSGNLLIGPTAKDLENKHNKETTGEGLKEVLDKAGLSIQNVSIQSVITAFAGLRAHEENGDFIIGESEDVKGLINVIGIESPGLTSAPAIGEYVRNIVVGKTKAPFNSKFNPIRKNRVKFATATEQQRKVLIKQDKRYGKIVCRCENVTEAEIVQAIKAPLGAKTIDAIKKRTRAGMGRCQLGFCMNRVIEVLAEELHISLEEVTKCGGVSQVLLGNIKEDLQAGRGSDHV